MTRAQTGTGHAQVRFGYAADWTTSSWAATHPQARPLVNPWTGPAVSLILWSGALVTTNLAGLVSAGLGLVSVLPVLFWVALAVLTGSFAWAVIRAKARWPVLAAHLIILVAILHATPPILYGTLRYAWAWKHVGVVDYIANHGIHFGLGGVLGAYQGWPGFFALNSFLTSASGLHSTLGYASWVLPLNDLLWLGPVMLIAGAFTSDQRLVWTTAWLFELGNWDGQDYFSPQAFAFFLSLTVIAVCLRWLWHPRIGLPPILPAAAEGAGPRRWVMVLFLVPMMVTIASSHQLTPFMLLSALTVLVIFRQLQPWWLPLLMAAITLAWIFYGGLPWLQANPNQVFSGIGSLWSNVGPHLVGQGQVPPGQIKVDWGCRANAAVIGVLALAGFWRYRRHQDARARRSWYRLVSLAFASLPAAFANSYGGEVIFRVYLFALPFMAVAAAASFFPALDRGWSRWCAGFLAVTSMALAVGFSLGNYGQEAQNYFNPDEVAASNWLYRTAPPGAKLVSADTNYPWAFAHYDQYNYAFLDSPPSSAQEVLRHPVATVTQAMQNTTGPAYLILGNTQAVAMRQAGTWPAGAYQRVTQALLASGDFKVVYRTRDAMILQLAGGGAR
jgi:hypothetical protein